MKSVLHSTTGVITKNQIEQPISIQNLQKKALQDLENFNNHKIRYFKHNNIDRSKLSNAVRNLNLTLDQALYIKKMELKGDKISDIVVTTLTKLHNTKESDDIMGYISKILNDHTTYCFNLLASTPRNHSPGVKIEELEESKPIKRTQKSPVYKKNDHNERKSSLEHNMTKCHIKQEHVADHPDSYVKQKYATIPQRLLLIQKAFPDHAPDNIYNMIKSEKDLKLNSTTVSNIVKSEEKDSTTDPERVAADSISGLTEKDEILLTRLLALEKHRYLIDAQGQIEKQSDSIKNSPHHREELINSAKNLSPREKKLLSVICTQKKSGELKGAIFKLFNNHPEQQASKRMITAVVANNFKLNNSSEINHQIKINTNNSVQEISRIKDLTEEDRKLLTYLLAAYKEPRVACRLFNLITSNEKTITIKCACNFMTWNGDLINERKRFISNKIESIKPTTKLASDKKELLNKLLVLDEKGLLPEDAFMVFNKINPDNQIITEETADELEKELDINAQTKIDTKSSVQKLSLVSQLNDHQKKLLLNMLLVYKKNEEILHLYNQIKLYDSIINLQIIKSCYKVYLGHKISIQKRRELKFNEIKSTLPTTKLTKVGKKLLTRLLTLEQEKLLAEPAYLIYNKINTDDQIITEETANEFLANRYKSEEIEKPSSSEQLLLNYDDSSKNSLAVGIYEAVELSVDEELIKSHAQQEHLESQGYKDWDLNQFYEE